MSTVAPITDEELADIEAPGLTAPDSTVRRLAARIRAAEVRAKTAERERDEASGPGPERQRMLEREKAVDASYAKGRADERADVVRWMRRPWSVSGHPCDYNLIESNHIKQGAHVTGANGKGGTDG